MPLRCQEGPVQSGSQRIIGAQVILRPADPLAGGIADAQVDIKGHDPLVPQVAQADVRGFTQRPALDAAREEPPDIVQMIIDGKPVITLPSHGRCVQDAGSAHAAGILVQIAGEPLALLPDAVFHLAGSGHAGADHRLHILLIERIFTHRHAGDIEMDILVRTVQRGRLQKKGSLQFVPVKGIGHLLRPVKKTAPGAAFNLETGPVGRHGRIAPVREEKGRHGFAGGGKVGGGKAVHGRDYPAVPPRFRVLDHLQFQILRCGDPLEEDPHRIS